MELNSCTICINIKKLMRSRLCLSCTLLVSHTLSLHFLLHVRMIKFLWRESRWSKSYVYHFRKCSVCAKSVYRFLLGRLVLIAAYWVVRDVERMITRRRFRI